MSSNVTIGINIPIHLTKSSKIHQNIDIASFLHK